MFVLAELDPPGDVSAKIFRGSGKYTGIIGDGHLDFTPSDVWPDGSAALKYNLNWEIRDEPAPPHIQEQRPGDRTTDVWWIFRLPHQTLEDYLLPDGRRHDHHDEEGFQITPDNPDSPMHDTYMWAYTSVLFEPGGTFGNDLTIYQWAVNEITDKDGDQIFFWVDRMPRQGLTGYIMRGTGKFEGLVGGGEGVFPPAPWPAGYPGGPGVNKYTFWWTPKE